MLYLILIGIFGLISGIILKRSYGNYYYRKSKKNIEEKDNELWGKVLSNIIDGNSYFDKVYGESIYIGMDLEDYGDIKIVFIKSSNTLAILDTKGEKVIKVMDNIKPVIIEKIISNITWFYNSHINNIVNVFGIKMDKKSFKEYFKMDYEQFTTIMDTFQEMGKNAIPPIEEYDDSISYNINDILDKISKVGLGSLSVDERNYLNKYSDEI